MTANTTNTYIAQAINPDIIYNKYITITPVATPVVYNATNAVVVDLFTTTGTPYASVAAMEADSHTKTFTVSYAYNPTTSAISYIYITNIA